MSAQSLTAGKSAETYDVVVVGAGFAGMYMLHRLRGQGFSVRVYEQGDGVGGTWYWNRYPGARCDVESMQYSYSFSDELQQEWDWSERYAPQPEILRYANHVADRFNLRPDIQFSTRVERAVFDEGDNIWQVATSDGKTVTAKFVVLATGCLSNARKPDIRGLDSFKGAVYHTGNWPHHPVDFTGQRVGIIGTGSSGIQSVPVIAAQAKHLTVFQRTPQFSIPARNEPLTAEERKTFRDNYPEIRRFAREEARNGIYAEMPDRGALDDGDNARRSRYEARWQYGGLTFMSVYNNLALDQTANDTAADFVREKIGEIVKDPETAQLLKPASYPIGTKRICIDTDYFETFNRPNVTLVDIKANPIEEITPTCRSLRRQGIRGRRAGAGDRFRRHDRLGREDRYSRPRRPDAEPEMGGGAEDLSRSDDRGLPEPVHHHRPRQPVGAVQHDRLDRAACRLDRRCASAAMRDRRLDTMEAEQDAEDKWVAHVNEVAYTTLYPQANSWYMGANIPGKPRIFMPYIGGVGAYRQICNEVAAKGYEGFAMTRAAQKQARSRRHCTRLPQVVMPGLVPGIHVLTSTRYRKVVDGRGQARP